MHGMQSDRSGQNSMYPMRTKLKHVTCAHCKHQFFVRDVFHLRGSQIPLLLSCGHAVCEGCTKAIPSKPCGVCMKKPQQDSEAKTNFPLNVYLLGLIASHQSRPFHTADLKIDFQQSLAARLRQSMPPDQEPCSECGVRAEFRCRQCDVFYCSPCYTKIHGRALQSHRKIMLFGPSNDDRVSSNQCASHPTEALEYFCNECDLPGCSHCMLRSHQGHRIITQQEKNEELLPEFQKVYDKVAETLQRVHQTQKKLAKALIFPEELQNSEAVEASITQHFVQLHGVLQNIEIRLIDDLHQQRNSVAKKLDMIKTQLKEQEGSLQSAILMAATAKENIATINMKEVIDQLEDIADFPCHLVQDPVSKEKITFHIDKTVVENLETHFKIEVPPISNFNLIRTENLPEDYYIEPIKVEDLPKLTETSPPLVVSKASSTQSIPGSVRPTVERGENVGLVQGSYEPVNVSHIKDPSCFYVRQLSREQELEQLHKTLRKQALKATIPSELVRNKLYLVLYDGDKKWYRGRVKSILSNPENGDTCEIFYVDYGNTDCLVPIKNLRNISAQSSVASMMAMKCALHDIVPKDGQWHSDAAKAMLDMIRSTSLLTMHVMQICGDTYHVDLCKYPTDGDAPVSVRDALIFLEYGCFITHRKLLKTNPQSIRSFYEREFDLQTLHNVTISHVENPECLFAQRMDDGSQYLVKLEEDMTAEYGGRAYMNKGIIYTPEIGMPCAAPFDNHWYRGKIIGLPGERRVEVVLVDFGDRRELEYNKIRRLHEKFLSVTVQAVKISLRDVAPPPEQNGEWNVAVKKFLVTNLSNKLLKMFVFAKKGDAYDANLYILDDNKDINFNALLVQKGFAQSTGLSSQFVDAPKQNRKKQKKKNKKTKATDNHHQPSITTEEELNENEPSNDKHDPFRIPITILQAVSPDCVYVADMERERTIAQMMSDIQVFYNTNSSAQKEVWKKDSVCIVYSARDKNYCRAKILEVKSAKEVSVFFYDTAITETVTMKEIQSLHPSFSNIPAWAFKVKLAGVMPCGGSTTWLSKSCETLCDLINENQNSRFFISKMAEIENDTITVELWVKQAKTAGPLAPTTMEINSISRMMVDQGVALPIRGYIDRKDKVLASDLRQLLLQNEEERNESDVEWLVKGKESDCASTVESETSVLGEPTSETSDSVSACEDDEKEESISAVPLPPLLSAWIPAAPIQDAQFVGLPTYLDHDCFLYLHSPKQSSGTLSLIDKSLQDHYMMSKPEPHDMQWSPGDLCIAQYHADEKWYRAQVLEILEDDMIKVIFVDYGNVEQCILGTLRKRVLMGHIPIQATKCVIHGLNANTPDGKWSISDLDTMHSLLVEKICNVTVLERNPEFLLISIVLKKPVQMELITYLVRELGLDVLEQANSTSTNSSAAVESDSCAMDSADVIVEEYIQSSMPSKYIDSSFIQLCAQVQKAQNTKNSCDEIITGTPDFMRDINIEELNNSRDIIQNLDLIPVRDDRDSMSWVDMVSLEDQIVSSTPQNELNEEYGNDFLRFIIPEDVDTIELEPLHIIYATVFYGRLNETFNCELPEAYSERFKCMEKDMQRDACKQPILKDIKLRSPCCGRYTQDNLWYRAWILDINHASQIVKVQYIDYGNIEYLPMNKVHVLKEEWLDLPVVSCKCRLWGVDVTPGVNAKKLVSRMEEIFYRGTVKAKIKQRHEDFIDVELYEDEDCTKLLFAPLFEEGVLQTKLFHD